MATRYVRYIGQAHRRVITEADWKSVRLTGSTVAWETSNGFAVPLDVFTEDQVKKAIDKDPDLVITAEDEEFEPTPGAYDMTPRELRDSIENPVDVIALLNDMAAPSAGNSDPSTDDAPTGNVRTDDDGRVNVLDEDDEDADSRDHLPR